MNWIRFRYMVATFIWLGISIALAYGLASVGDQLIGELLGLLGFICFLSFLMWRNPEREEETAGIISFDDDD